jgi:hypothetical protein
VTGQPPNEPESRILPFRPRGSLFARNVPRPPVPDLRKYEGEAEPPDDYRHRMLMNGLGLLATILLIAGGLWIADIMAQMRKNRDCVLTGRAGCTPVEVPLRER